MNKVSETVRSRPRRSAVGPLNGTAGLDWPTPRLAALWMVTYLTAHGVLRLAFGETLETDEAEQILLGQWLLAGYDGQPPLYTWLQHGLFTLIGPTLVALVVLKYALQLLTAGLVFLSARRLCETDAIAVLATLSLLLIPQFAWESQRDLTHTPLAVTLAAATLFAFLTAAERGRLADYASLGIVGGLGLLTKHVYLVFAAGLCLTALTTVEGRRILFDKRIAISLLLAAVIGSPYLSWLLANPELGLSSAHKLGTASGVAPLAGLGEVFMSALAYLTPLWLALLLIPGGYTGLGRSLLSGRPPLHLERYLAVTPALLAAGALVLGVTHFKDRWMHPILFLFPILFFAGIPSSVDPRRVRWFTGLALTIAVLLLLAMLMHTVAADWLGKHPSRNFPFPAIAEQIRDQGFQRGLIVGENGWVGGNLKHLLPESVAIAPGFVVPDAELGEWQDGILLAWVAEDRQAPPRELLDFLRHRLNLVVDPVTPQFLSAAYQYSDVHLGTVGIQRITPGTLRPSALSISRD